MLRGGVIDGVATFRLTKKMNSGITRGSRGSSKICFPRHSTRPASANVKTAPISGSTAKKVRGPTIRRDIHYMWICTPNIASLFAPLVSSHRRICRTKSEMQMYDGEY